MSPTPGSTSARSMHDLGLAAWFGGSLMGAVGLNSAANAASDPSERAKVSNAGWGSWAPVNAVAIGAHLLGAGILLVTNADRVRNQKGVLASSVVKTALTGVALGATAWSGKAGATVMAAGDVDVAGATDPIPGRTPPEVAKAQKRLKVLQWAIPASTGALIVVTALSSEQQSAEQQLAGHASRIKDLLRTELHLV